MSNFRVEKDSLGPIEVPSSALWGAQTQRALLNFSISGWIMPELFIKSLLMIKVCAARANHSLGLLSKEKKEAIEKAGLDMLENFSVEHFPIDVFQTGSGTSSNMNINEVLARKASFGGKDCIHPNDDVNMSQSSNDVIPTALHVSTVLALESSLLPAISELLKSLTKKSTQIGHIVKTGRTHLMDAMPLTFGQELSGWIAQLEYARDLLIRHQSDCREVALGGTAVGTGINAPAGFNSVVLQELSQLCGQDFFGAKNFFSLMASQDKIVSCHGALKVLAVVISKIANDLRWMNSGPLAGLGEIVLPAVQPGSSIMPGKVNPVILESALMAAAHVIGSDTTMTVCGQSGVFELNVMLPLMAYHILENIEILANTCRNIAIRAIDGFLVCEDHILETLSKNPILVTALNTKIGYEKGAVIAKRALKEKRSVIDVAAEETGYSPELLALWLDPSHLTSGK